MFPATFHSENSCWETTRERSQTASEAEDDENKKRRNSQPLSSKTVQNVQFLGEYILMEMIRCAMTATIIYYMLTQTVVQFLDDDWIL